MKTKSITPKPSDAWNKPTATVAKALKEAPNTPVKAVKAKKTKVKRLSPPKKADFGVWVEIAKEAPPLFSQVIFGRWRFTVKHGLPVWVKSINQDQDATHWCKIPLPPAPKSVAKGGRK